MKREFSAIKFILTIALISACFIAFFFAKNPKHFPITQIKVNSAYRHVEPADLQATISRFVENKNFFTVNAKKLRETLEAMPWVQSVSIRRIWPNTLKITLKEQVAMVRWNESHLLNKKGDVFRPDTATIPENLPEIITASDESLAKALGFYKKMNQDLKRFSLFVLRLNLDKSGTLLVDLSNGTHILLGKQEIMARWDRFIKIYPRLVESKDKVMVQVDLRYPHGFAIKWKDSLAS